MKLLKILALSLAVFGCAPDASLKLLVENDSDLDREGETIELDLDVLSVAYLELDADNLVVLDRKGRQVASQIYTEHNGARTLVFQASVPSCKTVSYYLATGERTLFDTLCYSRYVPERLDDYAYENDRVAGRIYGPALESPRTFGSDIWCKNTSRLVLNERFAQGHYHENHGDGMDCYKVGNSLGGGALVPYSVDEQGVEHLILGDNWATQAHVTDGPVRTRAVFSYGPFDVCGKQVTAVRELTLDAGSHFVKWNTKFIYEGSDSDMKVALGAALHDVKFRTDEDNFIAFTEKASDSANPEIDGDISVGIIMDPRYNVVSGDIDAHAVLKTSIPAGRSVSCWTGSAWSQADVKSAEEWEQICKDYAYSLDHPLKLTVTK